MGSFGQGDGPAMLLLLFPVGSIAFVVPTWQCSVIPSLRKKYTCDTLSPHTPRSEFAVRPLICSASSADVDVCADVEADADVVFSVVDIDGNGSITQTELQAHLSKAGYGDAAVNVMFDKLDIDADGTITREELRAGFLKYT